MAIVANTGDPMKMKDIKVVLSGWTSPTGAPTSVFGTAADMNCTDVEYFSVGLPDKAENTENTWDSNLRSGTDSAATKRWQAYAKLNLFNDSNGANYRACVAAQETDATGTMEFVNRVTNSSIAKFLAKCGGVTGPDGEATALGTSFAPSFTIKEALTATSTATA